MIIFIQRDGETQQAHDFSSLPLLSFLPGVQVRFLEVEQPSCHYEGESRLLRIAEHEERRMPNP